VRGFCPRPIRRPGLQARLFGTRLLGTRLLRARLLGARILRTEGLRPGARVCTDPVQLRVQRERPDHVRREEPTRVQRRQRLRQGIVQPIGSRRFHPRGRVHRRRLQRFQRRSQENRRRIQGPVQRRPGLQTSVPRASVQTRVLVDRLIIYCSFFFVNSIMYPSCSY